MLAKFNWVLQDFIGFYWAFDEFYWVLTGYYRVLSGDFIRWIDRPNGVEGLVFILFRFSFFFLFPGRERSGRATGNCWAHCCWKWPRCDAASTVWNGPPIRWWNAGARTVLWWPTWRAISSPTSSRSASTTAGVVLFSGTRPEAEFLPFFLVPPSSITVVKKQWRHLWFPFLEERTWRFYS